jgi:subtilase family serine protease
MPRILVCSFQKCAVIAAFLVVALSASAQTRNRIAQRIEDTEPAVVMGTHPLARPEFDRGRVDGSMKINRAALVFKLASTQQAALEKLLAEQQDPDSPNYRKWLTPEQYAARFGMSDADLSKVASWLNSQGLTVNGFSRSRTRVFFSGRAAQVESVFRTELHQYQVNDETRFANAIEVSVPAALSGMMLGIRGLDNFRPRPRARMVKPNFTSHVSGNHFVAPGDFATIYNLAALYSAGFDGTGQKIAVAGQTEIHPADIDAFRSAAGLPAKNLQLVAVDGTGFSPGDEVEADLDVEWSGGVARNATILYVYTGSNSNLNVFDALEFAIENKLAPVISTSYGNCEANLGSFALILRQDVQRANSFGQTVTAASGDSGAADCDLASSTSATHGFAVDAPASVPEVTGIGGSEFTGDPAAVVPSGGTDAPATTYWGGTSNATDNLSSAIKYIPEMAWNDTTASIAAGNGLSATGGGASTVFTKAQAPWQTGLTPADGHRDVPDVSLTASPLHDGSLICSQAAVTLTGSTATSCSSGFRDSAGLLSPVGGTSVGAPAFAGIVAILNQAAPSQTATATGGLGNINPTLYALAVSTPSAFHDIKIGDNKVPCTTGSTGCPSGANPMIGLVAGTGYDMVTGLGSIDANLLVTSWPGFVATPDFSVGGTPISISAPGQSGTSTITVAATNGFSGTVNLTCVAASLPAGASCAFVPSSVVSPGTSTLTITTTAATPVGSSNITVTGTSGSTSHNTSINLTIAAPGFTMTASPPTPATVAAGGSSTSTITIAPVGGFTDTVNLLCSVVGSGTPAPTCSLVPSSVTNGAGTSTLTVKTTAPHSVSGALNSPQPGHGFGWLAASGSTLLVGVIVLGVPSRRRRHMAGLGLMLLVFFAAGVGCGGGSSSGNSNAQTGGTPAGAYTVTVTATSTSPAVSRTANVSVTVQ